MNALNSFVSKCIHTHTIFVHFYNVLKPTHGFVHAFVLRSTTVVEIFFPIDDTASVYMLKERMHMSS